MTALPPEVVDDLERENARLKAELRTARDHQNASAEILKVIASSPSDVQPVLEAVADRAMSLLDAWSVVVSRFDGELLHFGAARGALPDTEQYLRNTSPMRPEAGIFAGRCIQERASINISDAQADPNPLVQERARLRGLRAALSVPMLRDGQPIGAITVSRREAGAFKANEVGLLQTFADQAVIAIENARLFNETREALERQTATADILKMIARSPSDVQPVFEAIATSANRLIGGFSSTVVRFIDGIAYLEAFTPTTPAADELLKLSFPRPVAEFPPFRMAQVGEVTQIPDTEALSDETILNISRARGFRSMLFSPLMNNGVSIGFIAVTRAQPGTFSDHHVQLLRTFADQAVIAIENARLFEEVQARTNDLSESLQQQTAVSDVLKTISRSTFDLQPVLDTLVQTAARLCDTDMAFIMRREGDVYRPGAAVGFATEFIEFLNNNPIAPDRGTVTGRAVLERRAVHILDMATDPEYTLRESVTLANQHTALGVPLLRENEPIGAIVLTRQRIEPFTQKQIDLVTTFADQAVIAIENVRLFDQLRQRTDDLGESLQQQTATSEVLQIISSSPSDLAPVFEKMLENATRVCGAEFGSMVLVEGETLRQAALYNAPPAFAATRTNEVLQFHPQSSVAAAIRGKQVVQVEDMRNHPSYLERSPMSVQLVELGGARTIVVVPMLRDDEVIGVITVYRQEVRLFSEKQVDLLSNFARQAVIAIENARLLRELRQRTDDLTEALVYQTGSSNILKVIASSPTDVSPALKAIVDNACEICDANDAVVLLKDGDDLVFSAHHGPIPFGFERRPINRRWVTGRAVIDKLTQHVRDVLGPEGDEFPEARELVRHQGHRTLLSVPLLREGDVIGAILLRRIEVSPFSDKQIELLKSFADQAVIAISNVRLFEQVQARTEDLRESLQFQTATSDVLKVISSSPDALQPVLDVIVETSLQLCGTETSTIFLLSDGKFHVAAASGAVPGYMEYLRNNPIAIDQKGSSTSRAARAKRTVHIPDIAADPEFGQGPMSVGEPRALLSVPLMREGAAIGVITMRQSNLTPFTARQIEVVRTFADQAVIAISNVGLFEQVQERTRELSQSLDHLRTAQDRLVQTEKLASLGQLTAGIAHEIKNPLNFVNNFAALSAELTGELNDVLKSATLAGNIRAEVDELTGLLKDNLEKVVQHGKRADSIVKNMLLHSREGSGEHRPADINALLDESLNLAYHGARAEKPQFNVTLQRDFDDKAGMIELFPQEITRVFLNLIANGFYAVTRRKLDNGNSDFEPMLSAATKNLGNTVEIRIRDNGTGIPAEVREKMFNPFFTTKPAGEGTGLGLSMSHDIIVKQHGGSIEVETEPGKFSEFRIILPRTSNSPNKARGQT